MCRCEHVLLYVLVCVCVSASTHSVFVCVCNHTHVGYRWANFSFQEGRACSGRNFKVLLGVKGCF